MKGKYKNKKEVVSLGDVSAEDVKKIFGGFDDEMEKEQKPKKNNQSKKTISLQISNELNEKLEKKASEMEINKSGLIRFILTDYFKENK